MNTSVEPQHSLRSEDAEQALSDWRNRFVGDFSRESLDQSLWAATFDAFLAEAERTGSLPVPATLVAHQTAVCTRAAASMLAGTLADATHGAFRLQSRADRYEGQVRARWGYPLDLFMITVDAARRAGQAHVDAAIPDDQTDLFVVLTALHARSIRVASEVHHLLLGGFPQGALARSRTMHEMAVITSLMVKFRHHDEFRCLPERYLEHEKIAAYKDALLYQVDSKLLGYTPHEDSIVTALTEERNRLVALHTKAFLSDYGWATGVPNPASKDPNAVLAEPSLAQLAHLSGLQHLRSHNKMATREVHADARALQRNTLEQDGDIVMSAGRNDVGFVDPAQLTLIALSQTTSGLLCASYADRPSLSGIVRGEFLNALTTHTIEAFARA